MQCCILTGETTKKELLQEIASPSILTFRKAIFLALLVGMYVANAATSFCVRATAMNSKAGSAESEKVQLSQSM